jgi:hypothetical protein
MEKPLYINMQINDIKPFDSLTVIIGNQNRSRTYLGIAAAMGEQWGSQ